MSSLITEEDDEQFCSSFGRKSSLITEEDDKTILNAFIKHTKESKPPFDIKVTNKEGFDKELETYYEGRLYPGKKQLRLRAITLAYTTRPAPVYQELKLRECRTDSPSSSSDTSDNWHGISRKKHRQKTSDEHFESFGLTKRKRSTSNSSKRSESSDENSSLSSSKQTKPASKTTKTTNPEKPCKQQKNMKGA